MRKTNKSMAVVLAVVLMISMVFDFGTIYADGGTPTDLSSKLKVSNINIKVYRPDGNHGKSLIVNGSFVDSLPPIDKQFKMDMAFEWLLEDDSAIVKKAGDFFEYPVYNKDYIAIMGDSSGDLKHPQTGEKIAEYTISNGIFKVTLNAVGATKQNVKGNFSAYFQFTNEGNNIDLKLPLKSGAVSKTVVINPEGTTPPPANNPGHKEIGDAAKIFRKTSSQTAGTPEIRWDIHIGSENLVDLMMGNPINKREKFLIEDKITKNMRFKDGSVEVKSYLYVPVKDDLNKLSGHTPSDVMIQVTKIEPNADDTYETFRQRVQNATSPSYGVWTGAPDQNDIFTGEVFLFGWGDLPGTLKKDTNEPLTYYSMYKKTSDSDNGKTSMEDAIDKIANSTDPNRVITPEQANKMKRIYGNQNGVDGQIVSARISFKVDLVGDLEKRYENMASAYWIGGPDGVIAPVKHVLKGAAVAISGEPIDLNVSKEWKNADNGPMGEADQPDSITVKLMRRIQGVGNFVEAGKEILLTKGEWKGKFKNLEVYFAGKKIEYAVEEVDVDNTKYESKVTGDASSGFLITNKSKEMYVTVPVTKVWKNSDGSAMDKAIQPSEIKVKLTKKNAMTGKFEEVAGQEISLRRADDWEGKFENLPQKEATGEIIEYGVKEEVPEGYNTDVKKGDASGKFIITNTKKPKSSSGHKKPKPEPPKPNVEKPEVTPPAAPSESPVTSPTTPPVAPSEPPAAPTEVPRYPTRSIPNPNDPASPEVIEVIGDDGVPLGTYKKVQRPDGTFEYIDEEGIPLGNMKLVGTGNDFPEMGLIAGAGMSILGMALVLAGRRRKTQ